MSMEIEEIIKKYALQNAIKYKKIPKSSAVIGKIMSNPELRPKAKEIIPIIDKIISEISKTPSDLWEKELNEIAPELIIEVKKKKKPNKGLPPLDITQPPIMRFAPNPNGPPTIGSARGIVVNSEYTQRYNGNFILRFDDTDPVTKKPLIEAYQWYIEDCEWLGAKPNKVIIATDRMQIYYDIAKELIQIGAAYVCFCEQKEFKRLKDLKKPCPHRQHSIKENLNFWNKMLNREYDEHEAVLRIKTDIEHKDPAIRDWVAFRIVKTPHPRKEIRDKYCVYPLLDFEGGVEDHLLGITHIIRGKDLMDSELRQRYIYEYMGWKYPKTLHWGRMKVHEVGKLSTSNIRKDIENGVYSGWDDPRLPTLRAFKRRGITAKAIRNFMISLGLGETDISLSLENLYAENRKIIDISANRYFFVWDKVEMTINGAKPKIAKVPYHPKKPEMREIKVENKVFVCKEDIDKMNIGTKIRLKDLYNVQITNLSPLTADFIGTELVKKENIKIIHWAPIDGIKVKVLSPDGEYIGIGEKGIEKELNNVVQFERFGFVRIDSVNNEVIAYFSHK